MIPRWSSQALWVYSIVFFSGKDDDDVIPLDEQGNVVMDPETNLEETWEGMEAQVWSVE